MIATVAVSNVSELKSPTARDFTRIKQLISMVPKSDYDFTRCPDVLALADYFYQQHKNGKHLFFATTTYKQSDKTTLTPSTAARNLSNFYVALLQQAVHRHNFNRPKYVSHQPAMFSFLDAPASKFKRKGSPARFPEFSSDDFHHHSIIVADDHTRKKLDDFCDYPYLTENLIARKRNAYIKTFHICRIYPDADSIAKCVDYASDFARKQRTHPHDDTMSVFPISSSERQRPMKTLVSVP